MNNNISYLTNKRLWLAPLAGFTDQVFRHICRDNGAEVMVTEMVSADGLVYDFEKSFQYAVIMEEEKPIGIQIFGSNPDIMAQAAETMLKKLYHLPATALPDFIDINMGCPVKKVVKRDAGSALLKNLPLAGKIVKAVASVLAGTDICLSVKIRAGWDKNSIVALKAVDLFVEQGADIIICHPRTQSQMYSGLSDWSIIKEIKEKTGVPLVGNGDIKDISGAVRMFEYTGCDSIMIGRGALGNPWLFKEISNYLLTGNIYQLPMTSKYKTIIDHFYLSIEKKGDIRAIKEMKSHLSCYTKNIPGSRKIRSLINISSDKQEILELIRELYHGISREN